MTAFEKYLLTLTKEQAVDYVARCLATGPGDSAAWDLFPEGSKIGLEEIRKAIDELRFLSDAQAEEDFDHGVRED